MVQHELKRLFIPRFVVYFLLGLHLFTKYSQALHEELLLFRHKAQFGPVRRLPLVHDPQGEVFIMECCKAQPSALDDSRGFLVVCLAFQFVLVLEHRVVRGALDLCGRLDAQIDGLEDALDCRHELDGRRDSVPPSTEASRLGDRDGARDTLCPQGEVILVRDVHIARFEHLGVLHV